ncbi:MAG: YegP family protein [Oscillospiraceae bacterium]|nr:YegP family protein [Oscillospiraceae bacterium]
MGKFVIKDAKNGVMFNLKAGNNEIILTSETYNSLASCKNGIESVKKNAPTAPVEDQTVEGFEKKKAPKFEVYTDKAGETRFRLKAGNNEIIGTGESYKAKSSCLKGIESIRKNAVDAEIVDKRENK